MNRLLSAIGVKRSILLLLALPLLALTTVGGLSIWEHWRSYADVSSVARFGKIAPSISEMAHVLQQERGASAAFIGSEGDAAAMQRLKSFRAETDVRLKELREAFKQFDFKAYGPTLDGDARTVITDLAGLPGERTAVDQLQHGTAVATKFYTHAIGDLLKMVDTMSALSSSAKLTHAIETYMALLHGKEYAGRERAVGAAGFAAGNFSGAQIENFGKLIGAQGADFEIFKISATKEAIARFEAIKDSSAAKNLDRMRKVAFDGATSKDLQGVSAIQWFDAATNRIGLIKEVEDIVGQHLADLADKLTAEARQRFLTFAIALALTITAITILGFMIARNITKPIGDIISAIEGYRPGDPLKMPSADRKDGLGVLARSLNVIAETGLESARLKAALDSCQTNMMLADAEMRIVYVNDNLRNMFKQAESEIRSESPAFAVDDLIGSDLNFLHGGGGALHELTSNLKSMRQSEFEFGGMKVAVAASPVNNAAGDRIATVVEWRDRTAELAALAEIDAVVDAANDGDLGKRIDLTGKEGFIHDLSNGLNEMTGVVDTVISDISGMIEGLAEGDLTRKVRGEYRGRFGELKTNANAALDKLAGIVSDIQVASDEVNGASTEIASASDDLARRTEQAAHSLEQTATASEELAGTVKQNADSANQASGLANTANGSAKAGGEVVQKAVAAMGRIEDSAKRITDIIGVIDEIAFQTNLLALNASVEAARAGDAGKGFAVVAQEVRGLAQRSAEAADEIKQLIQGSNTQVSEGVELVNSAGDTLSEIVNSIGEVAEIVQDIATASNEQTVGVDEINRSVTSMDEMTQQNAAMVEESTAAARALSDQSAALASLMSFFQFNGEEQQGATKRADAA